MSLLNVKGADKIANIFLIEVIKSEKYIYSLKKTEGTWISLQKRADGRTILVDPRNKL